MQILPGALFPLELPPPLPLPLTVGGLQVPAGLQFPWETVSEVGHDSAPCCGGQCWVPCQGSSHLRVHFSVPTEDRFCAVHHAGAWKGKDESNHRGPRSGDVCSPVQRNISEPANE